MLGSVSIFVRQEKCENVHGMNIHYISPEIKIQKFNKKLNEMAFLERR